MRTPLDKLIRPRSVAVVGASRRPGSIGAAMLENLLRCGFQGPVYPVNPSASFVASVPTYPSISALPEQVDLAIIVVPSKFVLSVVKECGEKGVGGLVVITAGFKEIGAQGEKLENELVELVREYGMRMVGPNCLGVLNTDPEIQLNATFAPAWPLRGNVALSSQSGALGVAILDYAKELGLGISSFVSIGNKADVSSNDLIEYWENDPKTSVILLYLESFGNPQHFVRLARRVSRSKPVVAVKSGRTTTGRRAASSHTGALAGSESAVEATLRSAGVIRTDTIDELFDAALLLAHQPLPLGKRVAVLTNAGGPGIMAADACEGLDLELPHLSERTIEELQSFLPAEASLRNPVDMIASATADNYGRALKILLQDPNVDSVLVIFVPPVTVHATDVAHVIVEQSESARKPILTCFMGSHGVPEGLRSLQEGSVPSYTFPESAARALARVVRYADWRLRPPGTVPSYESINRERARELLTKVAGGREGQYWLEAGAVEQLMELYGLPRARSLMAADAKEAVTAARKLSFPVAVKLVSSKYVHKSDVGGVHLDLEDDEEVERAVNQIRSSLEAQGDADAFDGVQVQEMVTGGVEAIVGATRDAKFGHLIMFGLGGTAVEVLQDVTFNVHPLTDVDAKEMLDRVRGRQLLDGFRGSSAADREALADLLLRVSRMVSDLPEIEELDLNPVAALAPGDGVRVLDARIRISMGVSDPSHPELETATS
jgi:acetyl coenzyme A synthetase (ADP forming)-like protein